MDDDTEPHTGSEADTEPVAGVEGAGPAALQEAQRGPALQGGHGVARREALRDIIITQGDPGILLRLFCPECRVEQPRGAGALNWGGPLAVRSVAVAALWRHREAAHGAKKLPVTCPCGAYAGTLRRLSRHMAKEHALLRYKCPSCEFESVTRSATVAHYRQAHMLAAEPAGAASAGSAEVASGEGQAPALPAPKLPIYARYYERLGDFNASLLLRCPECVTARGADATVNYGGPGVEWAVASAALWHHRRQVHGVKQTPGTCPCGFRIVGKTSNPRHRYARHAGVTYKCKGCGFQSRYSDAVTRHHIEAHGKIDDEGRLVQNEARFRCTLGPKRGPPCSFVGKRASHLRQHQEAVHRTRFKRVRTVRTPSSLPGTGFRAPAQAAGGGDGEAGTGSDTSSDSSSDSVLQRPKGRGRPPAKRARSVINSDSDSEVLPPSSAADRDARAAQRQRAGAGSGAAKRRSVAASSDDGEEEEAADDAPRAARVLPMPEHRGGGAGSEGGGSVSGGSGTVCDRCGFVSRSKRGLLIHVAAHRRRGEAAAEGKEEKGAPGRRLEEEALPAAPAAKRPRMEGAAAAAGADAEEPQFTCRFSSRGLAAHSGSHKGQARQGQAPGAREAGGQQGLSVLSL